VQFFFNWLEFSLKNQNIYLFFHIVQKAVNMTFLLLKKKAKTLFPLNNIKKVIELKNNYEFIGVNFFGHGFINLYLRLFYLEYKRVLVLKRFLQFYAFFYLSIRSQVEDVFLSFLMLKLIMKSMLFGGKTTIEALLFSIIHSIKVFVGLPISSLFFNCCMSIRLPLIRTKVFLSGQKHIVPTPSMFDKQFKLCIKLFVMLLRKRKYVRDKLKRGLRNGHFIMRRIPFYNRIVKLSSFFIKAQSFFLVYSKKYQNIRALNNDVFREVKRNVYTFLLQRTYMQYRWR
jgi:hypothetical protein